MSKIENNKYYKYLTTSGQKAVVYDNANELDILEDVKQLTNNEKKRIKNILIKLIKQLDDVK
tara:strand:+ start:20264 stop:20449 length:186 start_codon:yes stop_codon:yes gene_type:complete